MMKLLEEALKLNAQSPYSNDDLCLRAECELAVAYYHGKVYGVNAAKAAGIKPNKFSAWAASKVMRGVRSKIIKIEMIDVVEAPKSPTVEEM